MINLNVISWILILCTVVADIGPDGVCKIIGMIPFTKNGSDHHRYVANSSVIYNNIGFSHLASLEMAVRHFNDRNPEIVPELENLDCDVILVNERNFDTQSGGHAAAKSLMSYFEEGLSQNRTKPCAIVGPSDEVPVGEVSVIAQTLNIPVVAYGSIDMRLVNPRYHPLTTRTSLDADSIAHAMVDFLVTAQNRTNFVALLYPEYTDTDIQMHEYISEHFNEQNITSFISIGYIPLSDHNEESALIKSFEEAARKIKASGYRTIVAIFSKPEQELSVFAKAADKFGITNGDHFWLISREADEVDVLGNISWMGDHSLEKLMIGAAFVLPIEQFTIGSENDFFLNAWRSQNSKVVESLNLKYPIKSKQNSGYFVAQSDYFNNFNPERGSGFLFDAVMSIGFGACRERTKSKSATSAFEHLKGIRDPGFQGSTGVLKYEEKEDIAGSRLFDSLYVGAFNIGNFNITANIHSPIIQHYRMSHVLTPGSRVWISKASYYYADGTTRAPILLRDIPTQNYLPFGAKIFGFLLLGVALAMCLCHAIWIFVNRKHRVLTASQPVFLYQLCFGSALVVASILPISFDESSGWSESQLSTGCKTIPWLIMMGHVIQYMAIFSKLWRMNRILQFRRTRVNAEHVVWPTFLFLFLIALFLSIWSAIGGNLWKREIIDEDTGESIGFCHYEYKSGFLLIPCIFIMVIPTILVPIMAWVTKDVDTLYSESSWIFYGIFAQLQLIVLSIPVLVILLNVTSIGRHVGMSLMLFGYSMSLLNIIMLPKYVALWKAKSGTRGSKTAKVSTRGSSLGVKISGLSVDRSGVEEKNSGYSFEYNNIDDDQEGKTQEINLRDDQKEDIVESSVFYEEL